MGILTDVLNKIKDSSIGLKRTVGGSEEDTKKKAERSRTEIEAEKRDVNEEYKAAL